MTRRNEGNNGRRQRSAARLGAEQKMSEFPEREENTRRKKKKATKKRVGGWKKSK